MKNKGIYELADKLATLRKAVEEGLPEDIPEMDEAEKWLQEQEAKEPEKKEKKTKSTRKNWEPGEVSDDKAAEIQQHIEDGHSEKEAHWLAGENVHGTKAEPHSSKVLNILRDVAKQHVDNEAHNARLDASESVNPEKYKEGRTLDAMEHHVGKYRDAYSDFLGSDELKDMSPRERHAAKREWQSKYKEENPEHAQYHEDVRDTASGEVATGSAKRKKLQLDPEQQKWFDYTTKEHMPEIEKNIAYLKAKGFVPSNIDDGDLMSHGVTGLMDAMSRYREDAAARTQKGGENPFVKYAANRIRGRMLDHISNERGPKGEAGGGGMSAAEAAQHLGVNGDDGEMPGMNIKGGVKPVSQEKTGAAGAVKVYSDEEKAALMRQMQSRPDVARRHQNITNAKKIAGGGE